MRTLIKNFFKLIIIVLIVYLIIFSFYRLSDDRVGVVTDIKNGEVVLVFTDRFNFIWQGAFLWEYRVDIINTRTTSIMNINVAIPSLAKLRDDIYFIKIPFAVSYIVNRDNPPDKLSLGSKEALDQYVGRLINEICSSVLTDYIEPVYNRDTILKDEKNIYEIIISKLREKFKDSGIICSSLDIVSKGYFPRNEVYQDGLVKSRELLELDFENMKKEIALRNSLLKEKNAYELYYEKLNRISQLMKENPDILKFIYIDKMGDDIKVIISSDKTGIPAMFGNSYDEKKTELKGDIDNLR